MACSLQDRATIEGERVKAHDDVWVASINKDVVPMSATLTDGACLDFFPILEGG